jgi:hypothetical protein
MFLSNAIINTSILVHSTSEKQRENQKTKYKLLVMHVIIVQNEVGGENEINQ